MRLALILLTLFCVYVSVSHQQQRRYPMPYYYYNSFYNSPPQLSRHWLKQAPYYVVRNNYVQPSFDEQMSMNDLVVDGSDADYSSDDFIPNEEIVSRAPVQGVKTNAAAAAAVDNKEARLFFLSNMLNLLRTSTSTTIIISTVTSTITSATVKTCADSAQFIATTVCRRRRSVDDFDNVALVAPSQVQPMEVSAAPQSVMDLIREQRNLLGSGSASSPAEIESSQLIHQKEDEDIDFHRQKRQLIRVVTASSTVTITSYSIVPSTITKSITLGLGGCTKCVSCVPSGFTIC